MTSNAIAMTRAVNDNQNKQRELRENKRSNLAKEAETYRSNRAKEALSKYDTDMKAASKQSVKVGGITVTGAPAMVNKRADQVSTLVPGTSSADEVARTGKTGRDSNRWNKYQEMTSKVKDLW